MKIVIDDKIPFIRGVFEPFADVEYVCGSAISGADARDADALIVRTRTRCDASLLEGSRVRCIATATIGYDHIDAEYCRRRGIAWTAAPGCNAGSVEQYICSALTALARRHGLNLEDMTLGVAGVGPDGFCSLDGIIGKSDIITLHVPLNRGGIDGTFHLFDAERISSMNKRQFLINASRGEVVDGAALKGALKSGSIAGAVLDVWENEPEIDCELARLADISTPHIAGYSAEGKAAGTTAAT